MQPGGSGDPKTRPDTTPMEMSEREFAKMHGKDASQESTEFYSEIVEASHKEGDEEEPREGGEKSS